ncbi:MAG: hypothetical protein OES79_00345 [Planctomycetota bacterium]|nr:hypothetical protein [Planctomycetota bacterium]
MSVVDQALLKLFANQRRPSDAEPTHRAHAMGTATSTADTNITVPTEATADHEPFTSDANDRLLARRFDIPSTISSLGRGPTNPPKPMGTSTVGLPVDGAHEPDLPETDLQIAGLKAAAAAKTAVPRESRPEVVDPPTTTPDFAATTFRFDTAHERRVPTAHLLPLAGREANEEPPVETEDVAESPPPETEAVPETAEVPSRDEPDGPSDKATDDFKAAFEVDHFLWPAICKSLCTAAGADLQAAATRVLNEARRGQNVVAVAGLQGAAGGTTFALCLAQQLAALEASVLVVDANFGNPSLARSLGIHSQFGWNQDSPQPQPIAETLIESLQDRVTIAPLNETVLAASLEHASQDWGRLMAAVRDHFDVVLVDAEPLERSLNDAQFSIFAPDSVDQVILLQTDSQRATRQLVGPVRSLLAVGVKPLGIVRNAHAAAAPAAQ